MYSYEDRIRAVKLYSKLGKRLGDTIRQLGYPTKNSLIGWHSEYERRQDLRVGYSRSGPKYSDEQKHASVKHYLDHDRCVASTIRALGYRSFQPQPTASKPAPAKEVASRTLACPPEKTENREASEGAKRPTSRGWRSRGHARKPRKRWGNRRKKPTENSWVFK